MTGTHFRRKETHKQKPLGRRLYWWMAVRAVADFNVASGGGCLGINGEDYEQLIAPMHRRMVDSIWRIVRNANETEDVLQEALLKILKSMDRIRGHPNPSACILRICVNRAIDHLRSNHRRHRLLKKVAEAVPSQPSAAETVVRQEQQERVLAAIKELSHRQAEALTLLAIEGLSYSEIAAAMGCREATVRVTVFKARNRLRKQLRNCGLLYDGEVQES